MPHLVPCADRDHRRHLPLFRLDDLFDPDDLGAIGESVLQEPRVRVELRQVVASGVRQDHDDDVLGAELRAASIAATTAVPLEPPTRIPSSRVIRRAIANASRSLTRT